MGALIIGFLLTTALLIVAAWFKVKEWLWPEMSPILVGFVPSFLAQCLAICGLALICTFMSTSFGHAWSQMQREHTKVGKSGAFLVMLLPTLAGLFLVVGPLWEKTEQRGWYVGYALLFYLLSIVAVLMVVHDDRVIREDLGSFSRLWAWNKTSIVIFPFALAGYFFSPVGTLGYVIVLGIITYIVTWVIVYWFKQNQLPPNPMYEPSVRPSEFK